MSPALIYKVRYIRLPDLLNEFAVAKALNTQFKVKTAYARFDLLIIDEWLLRPLREDESYNLLELIEACSSKGAMIPVHAVRHRRLVFSHRLRPP